MRPSSSNRHSRLGTVENHRIGISAGRVVSVSVPWLVVLWTVLAGGLVRPVRAAEEPEPASASSADYDTVKLRGRVAWLSAALARRYGVHAVQEAAERVLVLESPTGELHPLVEDIRGRSFRRDERLRKIDVELTARRYQGSPFVQVIRVVELAKDGKYELDYWCDICSITMYELKECDCCQGPIELRRRKVEQ